MVNKYTYVPVCAKEELEQAYVREGMSQVECAQRFNTTQKVIWATMKRYCITSRVAAKRNQTGELNHMWKGDKATYAAFHRRLYTLYGKPLKCTQCGSAEESRSYDYANLTGDYANPEDYAAMCRSCHWKYDKKILNIKHMRGRLKNAGG